MRAVRIRATNVGIQRIQAMNKIRLDQEFQRPIDRWRRGPFAITTQRIENIVGADRLVAVPYQLQHPAPNTGQP